MNDNSSHPYQIVVWQLPVEGSLILDTPYWKEMARCNAEGKAKEVAFCLSLRHRYVAVAKLNESGDRFVNYLYWPDEVTVKQVTGKTSKS